MLALEVLGASGEALSKGPIPEVAVARTRVCVADLVPHASPEIAQLDLGPAPAPGGARVVTREELRRAIEEARSKMPPRLPAAVRVVRKMTRLMPADLDRITRKAMDSAPLGRGATLSAVKATSTVMVPAGWDSVRASLPKRPHRAGVVRATALLTFSAGADVLAAVGVPVELSLTAEAAAWDVAKGSALRVVVRRGAIEVEAPAIAAADADIGGVLPVMLRSTGRVVRVKLVDQEHGELVEGH
jgi:hypothetical protein